MEESSFFRKDALKHQHEPEGGQVMLAASPSFNRLITIISIMLTIALLFLISAKFSHYETVKGILVESQSTLKVYAAKNAIIKSLEVKEGELVQRGQTVAVLRSDSSRLEGGTTDEAGKREVLKQLDNYKLSKERLITLSQLKQKSLEHGIEAIKVRKTQTIKKIALASEREELAKKNFELEEQLMKTGSISVAEFYKGKSDYIRIKEQILDLNTQRADLNAELIESEAELARVPIELSDGLTALDNDISKVKRQLIELESEIEWPLDAINEGVVTNIIAKEGEFVLSSYPLFSLTPATSDLIAELYVPSRAIGFVTEGLEVHLRFDAFPHQTYGHISGKTVEISKVLLFPDEWPNPMKVQEPIYRVKVKLDKDVISDGTEQILLQSGLNVDADIVLEQQSILKYLLSPLLNVKT